MIYDITLKIRYDYTGAAAGGRQMVRITPLEVPGRQRVVASLIEITPDPAERRSWRDFFLNPTVEFALSGAHDHIDLTLRARVERQPSDGWLPLSIRLSDMVGVLKACNGNQPQARWDRAKMGSKGEAQGRRAIAAQEPGGAQTGRRQGYTAH